MKVAVLGIKSLPASAGADRVVERLLDASSSDVEYLVYLIRNGSQAPTRASSKRTYVYVPAFSGKHLRAASYFLFSCLHLLWHSRSVDVVHVHNSDFGLLCPLLRLRPGLRVIGTFHGDPYKRQKWGRATRVLLRMSQWVFVRSCHELTSVSQRSIPGYLVRYIPNGIETSEVVAELSTKAVEQQPFIMFACGRLDRTKGLHHLLAAYEMLPTDAGLVVYGDFSHDRRYAEEIVQAVGSKSRILLNQYLLPREELRRVVHRCSVFVFPSDVEAASMMLLEAIGWGALVVCSDIAENIAIVGPDYPYLFTAGDPESLREVLRRALDGWRCWDGAELAARVSERFCWEEIVREYESLYA